MTIKCVKRLHVLKKGAGYRVPDKIATESQRHRGSQSILDFRYSLFAILFITEGHKKKREPPVPVLYYSVLTARQSLQIIVQW